MKRNVSLEDISDGRLYGENDMVKCDCHGCEGCSDCCHGMGESVVLDPYDVNRLSKGLNMSFMDMVSKGLISLSVIDGLILPHLNMSGPDSACMFLNDEGRCSIHSIRPSICRLFPLGRYYEDGDFKYFLQTGECKCVSKTKIKVKKWVGEEDFVTHENFVNTWHYFVYEIIKALADVTEAEVKVTCMKVLEKFYITPYSDDFYVDFNARISAYD